MMTYRVAAQLRKWSSPTHLGVKQSKTNVLKITICKSLGVISGQILRKPEAQLVLVEFQVAEMTVSCSAPGNVIVSPGFCPALITRPCAALALRRHRLTV